MRAYTRLLAERTGDLAFEEVRVVTSGDRFRDQPLQDLGGKGLFIKEVEEALLDGRADLAVHSIKDVPAELAPGLRLAANPAREDPRDALVSSTGATLRELGAGAVVGTSSLRRKTALLRARPDLRVVPLRGNVDTRLGKLAAGEIDAIVLACAGLRRLGLEDRATEILDPAVCLPAVGQGALGIECREDDEQTAGLLGATDDAETALRVAVERAFLATVEGNCRLPVAAYAVRAGADLWLRCMLAEADGSRPRFDDRRRPWPADEAAAAELGRQAGAALRQGAR